MSEVCSDCGCATDVHDEDGHCRIHGTKRTYCRKSSWEEVICEEYQTPYGMIKIRGSKNSVRWIQAKDFEIKGTSNAIEALRAIALIIAGMEKKR